MSTQPPVTEVSQNILPLEDLTALVNGKETMQEKLDVLYLHVEVKAREMIGWYLNNKLSPARWSRVLGLVAAILGFDKFFGFSSAWMRYMLTQIRLQKKFAEFQLEWLKQRSFVDKNLTKEPVSVNIVVAKS